MLIQYYWVFFQWLRRREGQHSILFVARDDLFWNLHLPFWIRTILPSSRYRLFYCCTGKTVVNLISYLRLFSTDY